MCIRKGKVRGEKDAKQFVYTSLKSQDTHSDLEIYYKKHSRVLMLPDISGLLLS